MKNELTKKYGLLTAVSAVIGIVIGSGVFFKAQDILKATDGNMVLGILAWIIGGIVMLISVFMFSHLSSKYEKVNGLVDYAEKTIGGRYSYYMGWFLATIYYPAMTSVLAWVTARYFCVLFNMSIVGAECLCLTGFILIATFVWNALSPKLAGKIQVSTTIIKLIPIVLMAIGGIVYGLVNGLTITNFTYAASKSVEGNTGSLLKAVVSTAFAYEGWICVTSINSEIKNAKKNLPIALAIGGFAIIGIYILYYIGVAGGAKIDVLVNNGATIAFTNIFGKVGGTILNILIVVSCLGTLNGLTMGSSRCIYSIACRGQGIKPEKLSVVDKDTNTPIKAIVVQLLITSVWLVYFYGANLTTKSWFGYFSFDSSELPIITIYGMYIPIFISYMIKEKNENVLWRYLMPILTICASLFMIFAAIYSHGVMPLQNNLNAGNGFSLPVLFYLIIFTLIMLIGAIVEIINRKKLKNNEQETDLTN